MHVNKEDRGWGVTTLLTSKPGEADGDEGEVESGPATQHGDTYRPSKQRLLVTRASLGIKNAAVPP